MKNARAALNARYLTGLRNHLVNRRAGGGERAQRLGRAVLADGLTATDLAMVHEQALTTLAPLHDLTDVAGRSTKRARLFFAHALRPLEAAERATRQANLKLERKNKALHALTAALAAGNRRLEREIKRRKIAEVAIRRGNEEYEKLFLASQVMQRKLRQLTHQIIFAQEEERKEISRELHDEVVQMLVGINVELSALSQGTSSGLHTIKLKIARTQRLVANSVSAVHRFARELRPAVLDDLGLIPALHAFSKNLAERKRLKIELTAFGGVEGLSAAKRTVLYRVAQEALTNVARHAHASRVRVTIARLPHGIRLEISDDGKSFPVEKVFLAKTNRRLGLLGMKERVEMVGGTLAIESRPGEGTTVRAEIPASPKENIL
jgi:signal transduction histidine kinase